MVGSNVWLVAVGVVVVMVDLCSCGVVVEVTGGRVEGVEERSEGGRVFTAFRGIPFAKPPVGDLRFEPTQPLEGWEGTRPAARAGVMCAQGALGLMQGEEDCLHLSVYTPAMPTEGSTSKGLPVVVWLHGGAFVVSGAGALDPRLLMDRDVVLVVPQYRLGFFGFVYAMSASPGNYGMLDQVAALHWVQDNALLFGGDPGRVTLGGDCAGGASALYHMISPLSQGLFHGVVSLSGSPLQPWALQPEHRRNLLIFSNYIKCPNNDLRETIKCFKEMPLDEFLEAQMYLLEARDLFTGNAGLCPVVQGPEDGHVTTQFLPEHPLTAFTEGNFAKVPILLGVSKDVGNYMIDMALYEWMVQKSAEEKTNATLFRDELVGILITELRVHPDKEEEKALWQQYLPGLRGAPFVDKLDGIAELVGDGLYNAGIIHTARLLNHHVDTWLMRFDFVDGPHSFDLRHPDPTQAPPIKAGAGHGDELYYFLPEASHPLTTPAQRAVSKLMLDALENFAYGRAPREDWPTTTDAGLECAVVRTDGTVGLDRFTSKGREEQMEMMFAQQHKQILKEMENPKKEEHPKKEEL